MTPARVAQAPAPCAGAVGEPVLVATDLTKAFGRRQALRAVSFAVHPRELVAVIGPNGAGKTTLLSILAGAQSADGGQTSRPAREVGWVPQQAALYPKLSARENLMLFARLERIAAPRAVVERLLEHSGLAERADDAVAKLSGGNRQRLNIAIGLLGDPPVLALDEPSSGLDPRQRARLWRWIQGLAAAGAAVLFATHDLAEAERHAQRVLVLGDGELLLDGPTDALRDRAPEAEGDYERAFVSFLAARGH